MLFLEINHVSTEEDLKNYTANKLQDKLLYTYGDEITISSSPSHSLKKLVFKKGLDVDKLIYQCGVQRSAEKCKFENIAYELRNSVKSIKKQNSSETINVNDIIEGDCQIPELLFEFMCNLVQGPDTRWKDSVDDFIKIKSLCSDIIYIITKGRIKPAKHLTLGLAMKSLTSSRKVLTILNRYGHSINYTLAEELETELTYTSVDENRLIPSGISLTGNLSTHVAYDNYDRFVETLSGKDTLHDTVGIIYQFTQNDDENVILPRRDKFSKFI